jgi:hypothetical protein
MPPAAAVTQGPAGWAVESFEDETDSPRGGLLLVACNSDVTFCRLRIRPSGHRSPQPKNKEKRDEVNNVR